MKVIGIDVGGTKCGISLAEYNQGNISFLGKTRFNTSANPDEVIHKLLKDISGLLEKNKLSLDNISAAGINCGGPLDAEKGVILCPPNLPGWINVPVVQKFEEALGIPVCLQNDANAGAVAEHLFGAGRGFEHFIFLTHGTGMGAGLILNGKLYSGASSMAGEVGHMRLERFGPVGYGKAGSFEGFCSGGGIAKLGQLMALEHLQKGESVSFCENINNLEDITAKTISEAAQNGDKLAREIFAVSGRYLGRAVAILIDILNPQRILLGSVYGHCKDLLQTTMLEEIEKEAISFSRLACEIKESGLGDAINDYEAVSVAIQMASQSSLS